MQLAPLMPLTVDLGRRRERRRERRASHVETPAARPRRHAAPQDRALYTCGCGFAFTAAVSTSVGCPHCGTAQAW